MEAAVRLEYTRETCTDVACQWNKSFTKGIECMPICKMNLYSETCKTAIKKNAKDCQTYNPPSTSGVNKLLSICAARGLRVNDSNL